MAEAVQCAGLDSSIPGFRNHRGLVLLLLLLLLATGQLCHVRSGSALFREIKYPRDRNKTSHRFDCIMLRCYMVAMNDYYINNKMLT